MEPIVEAHAINTYVYCPRRCYYEYVERVFYHNVYTVHGKMLHNQVDTTGRERRGEREVHRSLYLFSPTYHLSVRCDVVEENEGMIYPVEYKRSKTSHWENNYLQLCAQALALEEYLYLQEPISHGYLFFYGSFQRVQVDFTKELRQQTIQTIASVRDLFEQKVPPAGIDDWKRCQKCSMVDYCLPHERTKLKGKIKWEHFI